MGKSDTLPDLKNRIERLLEIIESARTLGTMNHATVLSLERELLEVKLLLVSGQDKTRDRRDYEKVVLETVAENGRLNIQELYTLLPAMSARSIRRHVNNLVRAGSLVRLDRGKLGISR